MDEYRWVRWRTRHSSGPSYWQWTELPLLGNGSAERQLRDFLENMEFEETTHSEHWRGIEGDFASPPPEVLEREIKNAKNSILRNLDALERLGANIDPITGTKLRLTLS